ncbi:hypothetical protein PIB30_021315 [Stylosanthes scabra]|uniref:Uncharacterized protein n=1 Tax=Stylosanthes scabra TaxID=79078 RepID=A0ABU6ZAJ8_9FABA|nr:hypothetical protein [Stylosanthes scabra]
MSTAAELRHTQVKNKQRGKVIQQKSKDHIELGKGTTCAEPGATTSTLQDVIRNERKDATDAKRRGSEELGDASHDHTDRARFEGTQLRGVRPLTATTPRRGSVRIQLLGPKERSTFGPVLEYVELNTSTGQGASWPAHWKGLIRPGRKEPTRRALHERDMTRSLLPDGMGTCSHALLRNLRTCTSSPSPLQVLPPTCFIGDSPIGFTATAQA